MKRWLWIAPSVLLLALLIYLAASSSGSGASRDLRRERVTRGTVVRKAIAVGRIEVPYEVPVNSPTGGILTRLFVKLGDKVEVGQPLAEVRPILSEQALIQAERGVERASRGEESAREYLQGAHLASLLTRFLLGEKEIERQYRNAEEGRLQAQEHLELLKKGEVDSQGRKVDWIVRAPVSGHVLDIRQREGSPVVPSSTYGTGSMFITLADLHRFLFRGTVDEIDVGRLAEGMAASIKVGALPGTVLDGKLAEIARKAGERNNAVVFEVRIELSAPASAILRSGYSAVADIEVDRRENVLVLPERVVEFRGEKAFVGVSEGARRAEKEVRTGLGDGLTVEIIDGLAEGSEVLERE
jgi:HlyD family secretion protein